jgi:hypothetical protein
MDARIAIPPLMQVPVYRKIAQKVAELRHFNMTFAAIAKGLNGLQATGNNCVPILPRPAFRIIDHIAETGGTQLFLRNRFISS